MSIDAELIETGSILKKYRLLPIIEDLWDSGFRDFMETVILKEDIGSADEGYVRLERETGIPLRTIICDPKDYNRLFQLYVKMKHIRAPTLDRKSS